MAVSKMLLAAVASFLSVRTSWAVRNMQAKQGEEAAEEDTGRCNKMSGRSLCYKDESHIIEGLKDLTRDDLQCIRDLCSKTVFTFRGDIPKCCSIIEMAKTALKGHTAAKARRSLGISKTDFKRLHTFAYADDHGASSTSAASKPKPQWRPVVKDSNATRTVTEVPPGCNRMSYRYLCNKNPDHVVDQLAGLRQNDLDCISANCNADITAIPLREECCKVKVDLAAALEKYGSRGVDPDAYKRLKALAGR
eukprot:TRINITY_DN21564_c0_g1_i1.p1 TRINITY_DN21564_c0_g1~~TRINITY_DN21564_c0_g1_i1.p1  ORF type:complete len:276 (+),score=61.69 TRINITY_DN21564_c0_g1_i1:79-828(+)